MSTARALRDARRILDEAGLDGWLLVRDLRSGAEIGLDPHVPVPAASLVKLPLALAVLDRVADGRLDGAARHRVLADAPGPVGLSMFRHPVDLALDDLVYLSTALSDNVAADTLLGVVPPAEVTAWLVERGITGLTVRHPVADLSAFPESATPDDPRVALTLATRGATAGLGHSVRQLDVARTSVTTATALANLLALVWRPEDRLDPEVATRVRALLAANVHRQRAWPDFASDASRWSSKTGTVLNLRHEAGVVEHGDGATLAVVALTASRVPAATQPAAEAAVGAAARRLHDELRRP